MKMTLLCDFETYRLRFENLILSFDDSYRLIDELKQRQDVDFYQDWKMVTIIIGHNDICSVVCNRPDFQAFTETSNVAEALDILYHHLPRHSV